MKIWNRRVVKDWVQTWTYSPLWSMCGMLCVASRTVRCRVREVAIYVTPQVKRRHSQINFAV